jgi:exopolysaccharide biosynthesis polyprenyl glycosylphosphotransferase
MIRLFRVFVPAGVFALLVSEIILVTAVFILAAYLVMDLDPTVYLLYDGGLTRILVVVGGILLGMHLQDLYSEIRVKSRVLLIQQLCLVMGVAFLAQGIISYIYPDLRMPLRLMFCGSLLALIGMFLWREFFSAYALEAMGVDRVLLVGGSPLLEEIGGFVAGHPEIGFQIVGYVRDGEAGGELPGGKILGPVATLSEVVEATAPRRIVVGMYERRQIIPTVELLELRFAGHIVEEAAGVYEKFQGRVCLKELRPSQLIYSGDLGPRPQSVFYQTAWNTAMAAFGVAVSAPVMLGAALAVKLSSPGPVFARQLRTGLNGEPFEQLKFRTLRTEAGEENGEGWEPGQDPRITRAGRWLRRLKIDDLPQLFNVLYGEMSIVGPRPERPELTEVLSRRIPYYRHRHCVKPGITGWAQIKDESGDEAEDAAVKLEYDLYYIKNMSLGMDTMILFHAVKALLLPGHGRQRRG